MNITVALLSLLSVLFTLSIAHAEKLPNSSSSCSKELEGVVYHTPSSAYDYLARISDQLVLALHLDSSNFDTQENLSIFAQFAIEYKIEIFIQPPFMTAKVPHFSPEGIYDRVKRVSGYVLNKTCVNLHGFDYDLSMQVYRFSTLIRNSLQTVIIVLVLEAARFTPTC